MSFTNTPAITLHNGQLQTTSLAISHHFGKKHCDIIRAIKTLDCSEEFAQRNFAFGSYQDKNQQSRPKYEITKDGFMFLCMGFTGKVAAQWKERYIKQFNQMEQQLNQPDIDTRLNILTECNQKVASIENHYQSQLIEQQYKLIAMTNEAYQLAKEQIKLLIKPLPRAKVAITYYQLDTNRPERFIKQVQNALKLYPNLNKTKLINECGYSKTDKTARNWLDAFEGEYWYCTKRSGVFTYNVNVDIDVNVDDLAMEVQA